MTRQTPSTVLVTGASGRTGRELLAVLDETPIHVRALTRSAAKTEALVSAGADDVVIGDLREARAARRAVDGCDAVLFAAGSSLATGLLRPGGVVDGDGVVALVDAAVDGDVRRFVLQSTIGVGASRRGMPRWARWFVLRWAVREKARAERALRDSGLDHVTLRPGWLTDDPATNDVLLAEGGGPMTGSVPRADVARLMVAALVTPDATNRTFEVVARESARRTGASDLVDVDWNAEPVTAVQESGG